MKLEKNDFLEIDIEDIGINGEGISHFEGMAIFIKGALVGERVRAKIILVKPKFCVAIIDELLTQSPDRVAPFCEVFGKCGGCSLQHLSYDVQLRYKRDNIINTFKKSGITLDVQSFVKSEKIRGYRNKMSLPVTGTAVGFYAQGSHRIVPITSCPIQFDSNEKIIKIFTDFLRGNNLVGYDETTEKGDVKHLVVRVIGNMTYVTIVTPRAALPQIKALSEELTRVYGDNYALYLNFNDKKNNVILGNKTQFISGNNSPVVLDGLKCEVHPLSFFQVNDFIRQQLYASVCKHTFGTVLDAYSGAGVLSAHIAKSAEKVIAIEIEKAATESAQKLIELNNIKNIKTINGDCAEEVPKVMAHNKIDVVVLDPPRSGCDRRVLSAVGETKVKKVVYVSCNPATLARDCKIMEEYDYKIESLCPFDMFPHTGEAEVLCILKKN